MAPKELAGRLVKLSRLSRPLAAKTQQELCISVVDSLPTSGWPTLRLLWIRRHGRVEPSFAPENGVISGAYLRVWLRGAPFILAVSIALAAIAYTVESGREARYRASADVFLATQAAAASGNRGIHLGDPERIVATQARLARLPIVAQRTLESTGIPESAAARRRSTFLDRSTVDTDADADILTFSVTDESPDRASQLASAYARAYTDYRRELDTSAVIEARKALEDELRTATGARRLELATRLAELRSQEAVLGSGATLVRQADEPEKTQPKPVRAAVLGGMLGFALTSCSCSCADGLRQRLHSTDEIEDYLKTPLLGSIPKPPKGTGISPSLASLIAPPLRRFSCWLRILTSQTSTAERSRS